MKLLVGLAPLLAILVAMGIWAIVMFTRLGGNIDVILRENYRSVLAAQTMKEALERMDSGALFAIGGRDDRGRRQFAEFLPVYHQGLRTEQNNVTLPGEQEMVDKLTKLSETYGKVSEKFYLLPAGANERIELYFTELLPLFTAIKQQADDVLDLNQRNMESENDRAREAAAGAARIMVFILLGSAAVATVISLVLSRSILGPIHLITSAARGMVRGNYDQVVSVDGRDELGEMASTFNAMARRIRDFQQAGTARLVRAQQTAQATIDSFPDPVVVVDLDGSIERSNPAARRLLGIAHSEDAIPWIAPRSIRPALADVLAGRPDHPPTPLEHALCLRDDGQERFYLPRVLAIRDGEEPLGAAVVLQDVTKFRLVDQLKNDMVATVSHELKTPLTSLQMAVHLLLEEEVGPLNAKQTELLLAGRQDAERLLAMVNDLLDLTRIEQGRVKLDLRPVASADLVGEAVSRFEVMARDLGIDFKANVGFGLSPVNVDHDRIGHVFDNLLGNALAHTARGGAVNISAQPEGDFVRFDVADNGEGIPPEYLPRIFEKFYRVPGPRSGNGAGLGLAIAREIVETHGGQIHVESSPGTGTKFSVLLPVATKNAAMSHEEKQS